MKISGWAKSSIAKTKHVEASLASVGKIAVDASGAKDGISLTGKDTEGRSIWIGLSADEVARVVAFASRGVK